MSLTQRGRKTAYDNIAAGSATGRELTIAGDTVSKQEVYGGGFVVSTSNNEHDITNINVDAGTSTSDSIFQGMENNGDGAAPVASPGGTTSVMNPTDPTDGPKDRNQDGYTSLEDYLNSLVP